MNAENAGLKIKLTAKGKTLTVLTGTPADIVDEAVTQALVAIAKEGTEKETILREQIGNDFVSSQKIEKRNWIDPNLPEGFSYSETILLVLNEMEAKGFTKRKEKIGYMKKRIIELRQKSNPKKRPEENGRVAGLVTEA